MNIMKRIAIVLLSAWLLIGAAACSKKKDDNNNSNANTLLTTIALSPTAAATQGSFSGAVIALLPSMDYATWKVDGTVRTSETTLNEKSNDPVSIPVTNTFSRSFSY